MVFSGTVSDMDGKFISRFGSPTSDRILVLPLLLKDKVAALVYADTGTEPGGRIEEEAVELLVLSTSAWLEVAALRKQAQKEGTSTSVEKAESAAPASPSASDPFAAHAPKHTGSDPFAAQAPSFAAEPAGDVVSSAPETAPQAGSGEPSPEDAEVHQKAQRFARLLVDEIKLYNQEKVTEGRTSKNLYDRLREDIDKSKATYQKRYGSTAAASGNYFDRELVRSLAEEDVSVMGSNFRSLESSAVASS